MSNNFARFATVSSVKFQVCTFVRLIVCRQSNVCFRPRLTLFPCSHARQLCTFGFMFSSFRAHSKVHDSLEHCVFATTCPTDQKSGLFVIVDFAAKKNSFQKSINIARCFLSWVCFMWSHHSSSRKFCIQSACCSARPFA